MKNKILYLVIGSLLIVILVLLFSRGQNSLNLLSLNTQSVTVCGSKVQLPKGYQVLAASVYSGSSSSGLGNEYDGYKQIDTIVTVSKPTVLILTGYEQNVWNIQETKSGLLKAVLLAGYYDQKAIVNNSKVKILGGKDSSCRGSYYDEDEIEQLNAYSQMHLQKNVNALYLRNHSAQHIMVDDAQVDAAQVKLKAELNSGENQFVAALADDQYIQLSDSDAGMQKALELGLIRPATKADAEQFDLSRLRLNNEKNNQSQTVILGRNGELRHQFYGDHSYVILKPFKFPGDMYGGNSATFYLAAGVPYPKGELSHSMLYNINDGTCRGAGCGQN